MALEATIQELKLPLHKDGSFYENVVKLIDGGMFDIDTLFNSLIINNIESIKDSFKKMLEKGVYQVDLFTDL